MSIGSLREGSAPLPPVSTSRPSPPAPSSVPPPAVPPPAEAPSPFAALVHGLGREVKRGEALVRGALGAQASGGDLGPAELIALQAGVYRYSEAVDLAARLVDHATAGLKTIVQGQ
jgi:hypothetical protein